MIEIKEKYPALIFETYRAIYLDSKERVHIFVVLKSDQALVRV